MSLILTRNQYLTGVLLNNHDFKFLGIYLKNLSHGEVVFVQGYLAFFFFLNSKVSSFVNTGASSNQYLLHQGWLQSVVRWRCTFYQLSLRYSAFCSSWSEVADTIFEVLTSDSLAYHQMAYWRANPCRHVAFQKSYECISLSWVDTV